MAMVALKKKEGFCFVSDYCAVMKHIEKVPTNRRRWLTCEGQHVLGSLTCCKDFG